MSVIYTSPALPGAASAVYFCRCGRTASRHGLGVRHLPPGWVALAGERDRDPEPVCPDCVPDEARAAAAS